MPNETYGERAYRESCEIGQALRVGITAGLIFLAAIALGTWAGVAWS